MKKILLILCLAFSLTSLHGVAFSECDIKTCSIKDSPDEVLTDYLENLWKIIVNVSRGASKWERNRGTVSSTKSQMLKVTNSVAGFGWYFSSFDYYVALPITNEVPYQIERDHRLLVNQNIILLNTLKTIVRNGQWWVEIEKVCDWVSGSCPFEWQTAQNILSSVIKNHKNIIYFYETSILGNSYKSANNFVLVPDNFKESFTLAYNKWSLTGCSECEGWFMNEINTSIERISNSVDTSSSGMQSWKDAWTLLRGTGNSQQEEKWEDKKVDTSAETLAKNTWKDWGQKNSSNPLWNTSNITFSDTAQRLDAFQESLFQTTKVSEDPSLATNELNDLQSKVKVSETIKAEIDELYSIQGPTNVVQNTNVRNLMAKMIQMHYNLVEAINTLTGTKKISEKVCNSQGQGLGQCSYP